MGGGRDGYAVKGGKKGGNDRDRKGGGKGDSKGNGKGKGDRDRGDKGKGKGGGAKSNGGPLPTREPGQPPKIPIYDQLVLTGGKGKGKVIKSPKFSELPIWEHQDSVKNAAATQQVFCVQGETGCGKSSVVPMLLRDAVKDARIAVTQPRRLAAISYDLC